MDNIDDARSLLKILEEIPDPRSKRGIRYRFSHLLLMCIYGVLSGYSEATDIAFYVELRSDYFHELLGIKTIPSHDTFSRVLRFANFEYLSLSLGAWLRENFPDIYAQYAGRKVLHVDGKATRAASEKSKGEYPIYHLNGMYAGGAIGVEVTRVGDKENEITCLPDFLAQFNLNQTIVTVDAIGCNSTVIDAIRNGGGNYLIPVKENQPRLLSVIQKRIAEMQEDGSWKKAEVVSCLTKGHGRIENVEFRMISDTSFIYEALGTERFFGTIAKIGIMDKTTEGRNGSTEKTFNRSIYITDIEDTDFTTETMYAVRASHWRIEALHWVVDVQLREDSKTARRNNAITNGSILRRFCLMVRSYDEKYRDKPFKRFVMANEASTERIENILFRCVANDGMSEDDPEGED